MGQESRTTGIAEFRQMKDAILLLKEGSIPNMEDKVLVLNDVAAHLWTCLERGMSDDELTENVVALYEVDHPTAEKDVNFFVHTLIYLGLVKPSVAREPRTSMEAKPSKERIQYRPPKIYVYDLKTEEEIAFGPHVRGKNGVHRATTRVWHGGCC